MIVNRPKRLKKEPIIDAVFEIRFKPKAPASNILPGVLFERLPGTKKIEKLPAADIPEQIRASDPNLQFAPVIRVIWGNFVILIGDNCIAIASGLPYSGWTSFKGAISQVFDLVKKIDIIDSVKRCSVKYVDLIERSSLEDQISAVNFDLTVGKNKITKENMHLRVEVKEKDLNHVISIVTSASFMTKEGVHKSGIVVDIDTIMEVGDLRMDKFLELYNSRADFIHEENIEHFFACLTEETLESLEPEYE